MPYYDFKCNLCEKNFTLKLKIAELGLKHQCPSCNSDEIKRVYSGSTFSIGSNCNSGCPVG
jgi:putative FmdB family regulatory protein